MTTQNCPKVPGEMYSAYISLWTETDTLKWGRVVWAIMIELATIAGSFAKPTLAIVLIPVGSLIIFLLWGMFEKDGKDQNEHRKWIDRFHKENGFPEAHVTASAVYRATWLLRMVLLITLLLNAFLVIAVILWLTSNAPSWIAEAFASAPRPPTAVPN